MILQLDRALDLTFDRVAACATIADWPARVACWLLAPSTRTIRASASGLSVSAD